MVRVRQSPREEVFVGGICAIDVQLIGGFARRTRVHAYASLKSIKLVPNPLDSCRAPPTTPIVDGGCQVAALVGCDCDGRHEGTWASSDTFRPPDSGSGGSGCDVC